VRRAMPRMNPRLRGWIAFGAGVFLALFMASVWIWIDRVMASSAPADAATAAFLGKINVACALVVVSGVLGAINGWMMARTGRRNVPLMVGVLLAFVIALVVAWSASNAYRPS